MEKRRNQADVEKRREREKNRKEDTSRKMEKGNRNVKREYIKVGWRCGGREKEQKGGTLYEN